MTSVSRWTLCLSVCAWVACAQGYPGIEAITQSQKPPSSMVPTPTAGHGGAGGAGSMAPPPKPEETGEPCTEGQTQTCTCENTGTEGSRDCKYSATSPTGGYFGECSHCKPLMMPEPEED